jgi:hypothetical protein
MKVKTLENKQKIVFLRRLTYAFRKWDSKIKLFTGFAEEFVTKCYWFQELLNASAEW